MDIVGEAGKMPKEVMNVRTEGLRLLLDGRR